MRRPAPGRIATLFFVGSLLMQIAWIFALPPFRGIDEFDHAFRAAAVANGQWLPSEEDATNGRGNLQVVPRAIVEAAQPVCESYRYTGPDNCRPIREIDDVNVVIATAAGRYNPLFYWMIGAPASVLDGASTLYAMRFISALFCSGFIALAGWAVAIWARSNWAHVGLLLAMSPVAIYSSAIAAPNGAEICAGVALWASLLGLAKRDLDQDVESQLLSATVPSLLVLATVRQLGPLFLALILATTAAAIGWRQVCGLATRHRRQIAALGLLTAIATTANVWWIQTTGALTPEAAGVRTTTPFADTLAQLPLWTFQTVAAFPTRNEQAPALVYAIWLPAFGAFLTAAFWVARRRDRLIMTVIFVMAASVPITLTLATIVEAGAIWQGRYGLPYAAGIPLVAGAVLDKRGISSRWGPAILSLGAVCLVIAQAVSVEAVLLAERVSSPLAGDPSWLMPYPGVPAALILIGGLTWCGSIRQGKAAGLCSDNTNFRREPAQ